MISKIKRYYNKLTITKKVLLLFSIQVIIPTTLMGTLFYQNTTHIIENRSISYTADLMKMVELRMKDFSDALIDSTENIIYDSKVNELFSYPQTQGEVSVQLRNSLMQSLRRVCLANNKLQAVMIASLDGQHMYTYDLNAGEANIKDSIPYGDMLRKARKSIDGVCWYISDREDGKKDIFFVRLLYSPNTFKEMGLIAFEINQDKIPEMYLDLSTDFIEDVTILLDDYSTVASSSSQGLSDKEMQWVKDNTREWSYKSDKLRREVISCIAVKDTPWIIVSRASMGRLYTTDMGAFKSIFILIMICEVILLSIFSIFFAVDIVNPINKLARTIKKFKENNIHEDLVLERDDEIGYLANSFNDMASQIDTLVNSVYKEQLTRKESELKALQSQINPHFLFNTLESINWMAQLNNVPEIRDMVTSLAALMEASIGKGSPKVPLKKELKYVDNYLLIMKNRYGDRLNYESDVDESTLRIEVPKLILQPLVENAIYHGIDRTRKQGLIKLTIKRQEDKIYIEIMDNGKGMMPEEVQSLNEAFKEDNHEYLLGINKKSIGLVNVNGRIKLFYGQDYGLEIESEYEQYTKMKLYLPSK